MSASPIMLAVSRTGAPEKGAPRSATSASVGERLAERAVLARNALRARLAALLPYLDFGAQRLGRSGIVGLALVVFSTVFAMSTNVTLRDQRQALRAQARLDEGAVGHGRAGADAPALQLSGFLRSLPRQSDLPRVTAQLVEQAKGAGIELERGTYELQPEHSGRFARYRISYPVTGTYPQVRHFVEGVLVAAPAVALESLKVERPSIADQRIAADVQFVVLLRRD